MYLLQLLLMMGCILQSKADTVTDDSKSFRIDQATSTMSTYINTESDVYHIELDSYTPGNLLFSDGGSLKTTDGQTTQTVAGRARRGGQINGVGEDARFDEITGFVQTSGRNVTLVDLQNHCLRSVDRLTLQTETFTGHCGTSGYAEGLRSLFNYPYGVVIDNQNKKNLLVTDNLNNAVRHVELASRNVSTFFWDLGFGFNGVLGITQEARSGDLYLSSYCAVYQLTYQDKILTILVGHPSWRGYQDGTFSNSRFNAPYEMLLIDNNMKMLVADMDNNRLRLLDRVSNTTESICTGDIGHADGDTNSCSLDFPRSLLVSGDSVYRGEITRIRKLSGVSLTTTQSTTTTATTVTTTSTVTLTPSLPTTTTSVSYIADVTTPCEATYYRKSSRVCEYCDCTSLSQSDQCDNTGQCPCETSDGENQELAGRQCRWYIEKISPLYGPVAGGTKVSITGGYFSQGQLKATLDGVPLNLTVSGNSASFTSEPLAGNNTTQQELKVSLIAQNRTVGPEEFEFGFEYRPNPILEGIQSRKTHLRIDRATSTMSTYINTESDVYHIELDSYIPGNLLFSDGHSLKTTDGQTTQTVAGRARRSGHRNGVGEDARFDEITGFVQTSDRNVTLVDILNHCLRSVDRLTLQTETFTGHCGTSGYAEGLQSLFNYPYGVVIDNQNKKNLLVTDNLNNAVRHVELASRKVSTFFWDEGFNGVLGITQEASSGDLYLSSAVAVYQLTYQDKILTILVGHPSWRGRGYQDGTFSNSRFNNPYEMLLIDNNMKMLIADEANNRLRLLDRVSNTTESICTGDIGHADGDTNSCSLDFPRSLLVSGDSVYIGELTRIRKLSGVSLTTTQSTTTTATTVTTTSTVTLTPSLPTTTTSVSYIADVTTPCEATYYRKSTIVCEYCDCTSLSQSDQCDNTGQCPCETSDGEKQELAGRQCRWYIEKISPLYGPVAGGTKVSITGGYFSQGQLKATLDGVPLNLTVSGNSASFISEPLAENKTTQQELKVSLTTQNRTVGPEEFEFRYEYRPNPILEGIQSRKTLLSGGLFLNVTGQHMDSVAFPQMIVYIRQYEKIVSTAFSVRDVTDSKTMSCPTPDVKEATEAVLNNQSIIQQSSDNLMNLTTACNSSHGMLDGRRVKRSADPGIWEPLNGRNGLGYTLGLRYDGYDNDTDLKIHPNPKLREISVLKVVDDPVIYRFEETQGDEDVLDFDPKKDKNIQIEGTGLDWDPDQWIVEIGRERCRVTSVSTNQIICKPPLKMPEIDAAVDYREHKGKQIPHLGSMCDCPSRVCVIVLPIIAIIAFIVILLCLLRRKRNTNKTENKSNQPLDETMDLMPVGVKG